MSKNQNKEYPPNLRDYLDHDPTVIKDYSKKSRMNLPDPASDPIVSNNISNQEFDYTYNEDDDVYYNDYYFHED